MTRRLAPLVLLAFVSYSDRVSAEEDPWSTPREAEAAAETARSAADTASRCMGDVVKRNQTNNAEAAKDVEELRKLVAEKKRSLEELAAGYYCSKCGRTASEIEKATKRSFSAHLSDVKGRPVPAPQSAIVAKAKEYDQKIASGRKRLERYNTNWKNFVSQYNQCGQERQAAYREASKAGNWAKFLGAREKQKAAAEARRKVAEARAAQLQARSEAARQQREKERLEQLQRLKQITKQNEQVLAQLKSDQAKIERKFAELGAAVGKLTSAYDVEARSAEQVAADRLGEPSPTEDVSLPSSEPSKVDSAYSQRIIDANANSILDPSTWEAATKRDSDVFPPGAGPTTEELQQKADGVTKMVDPDAEFIQSLDADGLLSGRYEDPYLATTPLGRKIEAFREAKAESAAEAQRDEQKMLENFERQIEAQDRAEWQERAAAQDNRESSSKSSELCSSGRSCRNQDGVARLINGMTRTEWEGLSRDEQRIRAMDAVIYPTLVDGARSNMNVVKRVKRFGKRLRCWHDNTLRLIQQEMDSFFADVRGDPPPEPASNWDSEE